jgi:hypothetical protein
MTKTQRHRARRALLLDSALAIALTIPALWIVLHRLGDQSLWLDEGTTQAYVTGHKILRLARDLVDPTQAYPLYHLVLKFVVRALGDGEIALRLPSAVAGAFAVPALYLLGAELRGRAVGLAAAFLLLLAPWGIYQAQNAKAYSLALLIMILTALLFARALRLGTRATWLQFGLMALLALFVHRFLAFSLLGCAACWALLQPGARRWPALFATLFAAAGLVGAVVGSLRYQQATEQFAGAGPLEALRLTFAQFAVRQFPGEVPRWWLAVFGILLVLGIARWAMDVLDRRSQRQIRRNAMVLLFVGGVPLALLLLLLALQPLYVSRYFIAVYPFWLLLLGWSVALPPAGAPRFGRRALLAVPGIALLAAALVVEQRALIQPGRGIFSGATIKEDYRGAVRRLAEHVHPDDLVLIHPGSIRPLYDYYARRVTNQPLPEPADLTGLFQTKPTRLEIDRFLKPLLRSKKRAWLLIAPDHARVIDPPPSEQDDLGWIGLAFQYGAWEGRIQCGEPPYAGFTGVRLYCNNMPDIAGVVPEPATPLEATFGDHLRMRGYSVIPFAGGPKPGGTLPVTLFWEPLADLSSTDYHMFLHLTTRDDPRPLTQTDGPPMEGGLPTSHWTEPLAQLHDDRTLPLPSGLAPGTYVLRMGVYRAADGQRLTAVAPEVLDNAVVLGEVQILQP